MKKFVLMSGVKYDGYGGIEIIDANNCIELVEAIVNTDRSQCMLIAFDGKGVNTYVIPLYAGVENE